MEALTLGIALAASALVFFLRPTYGLIVYVVAFTWYPTYLSVPIGTIDFTVRRIVIMAIFAKLFLTTDLPGRFKFIWLDKLVIIYFAAQLLAGVTTAQSLMVFLENRAGAVFDMVLPYFAVRMIITTKDQYLTLLKSILVIAAPLAIVSFYECLTGYNLFGFLQRYTAWLLRQNVVLSPRFGLNRAKSMFNHPIMLGLFFSMLGPVCAGLLQNVNKHKIKIYIVGLMLMAIGAFSSVSSGPWLAASLAVVFIAFYKYRKYWKPVLILIISSILAVEIISNRHFYDVLGGYTLQSSTAWYRSRLIDVALFEGGMSDHWLFGFGFATDPGWGPIIDGRHHSDIVNQYLRVLSNYGLVGLIPFLAVIGAAIKRLIDSFKICTTESDRWLVWCLSGAMFALASGFMTVSIYGPPTTIFSMILGFCGTMPFLVANNNNLVFSKSNV